MIEWSGSRPRRRSWSGLSVTELSLTFRYGILYISLDVKWNEKRVYEHVVNCAFSSSRKGSSSLFYRRSVTEENTTINSSLYKIVINIRFQHPTRNDHNLKMYVIMEILEQRIFFSKTRIDMFNKLIKTHKIVVNRRKIMPHNNIFFCMMLFDMLH